MKLETTPRPVPELVEVISLYAKATGKRHYRYPVYVRASESHQEMLAEAFALTTADDRTNAHRMPATTAGDLMVVRRAYYLVEPFGPCTYLARSEAERLLALDIPETIEHLLHAAVL